MSNTMPQTTPGQLSGDAGPAPMPRQLAAYTDACAAVRDHADALGVWLSIWSYRDDTKPDARARRCASDAVAAIDAAISELYGIRALLIPEIRTADDTHAARCDAMIAALRSATAGRTS
jgi:hypothetical protein